MDFDSQANLTTCFGVEDTGVLDDTIGYLMMVQIEDMKLPSGILEPLREKYDYILIDTCPSLETLTLNALTASDEVIITVNPQLLAMM